MKEMHPRDLRWAYEDGATEERLAIVAWLRECIEAGDWMPQSIPVVKDIIDAIVRGEHRAKGDEVDR